MFRIKESVLFHYLINVVDIAKNTSLPLVLNEQFKIYYCNKTKLNWS
jgi:hypothetical protein